MSPTTNATASRTPKAVAGHPKIDRAAPGAATTRPSKKPGQAVSRTAATSTTPSTLLPSKGMAASPAAGRHKIDAPNKLSTSTKLVAQPGQAGHLASQPKMKTTEGYTGLDSATGPSPRATVPRDEAELMDRMANICQQTLEELQPVLKQITQRLEKADRTPRDELDEEDLVKNVKPLIEEGSRILRGCKGTLSGLDPDGRIASEAKGRVAAREATPKEHRLAELLKELTSSVVTTIDNAKRYVSDMPHAKKKLNPLWSLLTEPLFQIIAAVGLLVTGVLNLVGNLLKGLGLGGLVNGLLGGTGIDKLLGGLGLGDITGALGIGNQKKGGGKVTTLPLVGGLVGGLLGEEGLLGGGLLGEQGPLGGGLLGERGILGARA